MSGATKIEWTEHTWNPVRGCSMAPGSETGGCLNCYAARIAARNLPGHRSPTTGKPFAVIRPSGPRWTGDLELIESALDEPLRRKKPTVYFVNSMSDLLHESLTLNQIADVWAVMAEACWHQFQVLTKRAGRLPGVVRALEGRMRLVAQTTSGRTIWPLPNVWLGVSCENQQTADERIPLLLQTPAAVRFLSAEPLLEPIGLRTFLPRRVVFSGLDEDETGYTRGLDWVIAGGESGPGARVMHPDWARSVRDQCVEAGVPFFFKHWGEWKPARRESNYPNYGVVRRVDFTDGVCMLRTGKKAAGRQLDGRTWDERPLCR